MNQGYTIKIINCTERDLTLTEYQSALSAAQTLDPDHTQNNPLVIESTVRTKIYCNAERPDLIKVCVMELNPSGEP